MPRQAPTAMDTAADWAAGPACPSTMHDSQPHPVRLLFGLCGLSLALLSLSLSHTFSFSHTFPFPLCSPSPSAFSSSFCVQFTFPHRDLFQQQNLRSTRKSLLKSSTALCECERFSHSVFVAATPLPYRASHLISIMQNILLII